MVPSQFDMVGPSVQPDIVDKETSMKISNQQLLKNYTVASYNVLSPVFLLNEIYLPSYLMHSCGSFSVMSRIKINV